MPSALDRTLDERLDELTLEDHEDQDRGKDDDERSGVEERDAEAVLTLEKGQRTRHRPLQRVGDEHDRQEELIPGPEEEQDSQSGHRRASPRQVDEPELLPQPR